MVVTTPFSRPRHRVITHRDVTDVPTFFVRMLGKLLEFTGIESLSYTILLEGVLAEKKCRQKHGGFSPEMTPLPWLLVPPAHEKTTDQAQFEPAAVQTTPLVLAKIFIEFWSFCSKFQLF